MTNRRHGSAAIRWSCSRRRPINLKIGPGGCRELAFKADRLDGFDGPIRIEVDGLPAGFTFHGPIEIEAGQPRARGVLSAAADVTHPDAAAEKQVRVSAVAEIAGREVMQELGTLGEITIGDPPKFTAAIVPAANSSVVQRDGEPIGFTIRPEETITAKVRVDRGGFEARIGFASNNLPHGVFLWTTSVSTAC